MTTTPTDQSISCRRKGAKYTRQWPQRSAFGYDVLAEQAGRPPWVAGFAVQHVDFWGRKQGWYVVDHSTGETIFGAGESTRIGNALDSCLFLFGQRLTQQAIRGDQ